MKSNTTITSLNTGGNIGSNDTAEKIANTREKDVSVRISNITTTNDSRYIINNDEDIDRNSVRTADYSDTDSEGSRSTSPNARTRLSMSGRR